MFHKFEPAPLLLRLRSVDSARALIHKPKEIKNRCGKKQLLLDVSVLIQHDAGTGIQRVVRSIWAELEKQAASRTDFSLMPVYATRKRGYRYVMPDLSLGNEYVRTNPGDIFLGLDWSAHILSANEHCLYAWKRNGVKLCFVLYDFLPMQHPEWFTEQTGKKFRKWLRTITVYADQILSISHAVQQDLTAWLQHTLSDGLPKLDVLPLGSDFENTRHSLGVTPFEQQMLAELMEKDFVLTVGTVEPRKGHGELLAAFDVLWPRGHSGSLVIAGRPGWRTEELQQRLKNHPLTGEKLFWFDHATDEFLAMLYKQAVGVVVPSKGEGYGLSVIEGIELNTKVLVRDLPVFREVGGNDVDYFQSDVPEELAAALEVWLSSEASQCRSKRLSWNDACKALLALIC